MPSIIEPSSAATRIVCGDAIKHFFIVGPANVLAREDGSRAKAVRRGRSSYEWNLWLSGRENWVPASAQSSENRRWRRNEEEKSIIVHNKYHFPFVVLLQGFHPHAHGKPNNIFNEYWCLSSEERFGVEIWKIVIWLVCGKEWREKKCCFRTPFGLERLSSSSSSHTKVFSHFSLLRVLPSKRPAWESANNFVNKHQPRTVCLHSLIPKHCAYIWGIIVCQGARRWVMWRAQLCTVHCKVVMRCFWRAAVQRESEIYENFSRNFYIDKLLIILGLKLFENVPVWKAHVTTEMLCSCAKIHHKHVDCSAHLSLSK